jgi:hypothetical protein
MGFLEETFDINDMPVAEKRNFDPVPAGWYTAAIAGAELKTTKAGTGNYIAVRAQLGDIMRATGVAKLEDTDQLLGGNLSIKVTVKDDPTYGPGNEVRAFKAIEGSTPPVAAPAAPPPWAAN